MRDIKFRGIGNGRAWEYGGYTYEQFEDADLNGHYICNQGLKYEVDGNTVGQYTGLKDKNGKEIYEGDIISVKPNGANYPINYVVVFNEEAAFRMRFMGRYIRNEGSFYDEVIVGPEYDIFYIIGNIHENPDLLK